MSAVFGVLEGAPGQVGAQRDRTGATSYGQTQRQFLVLRLHIIMHVLCFNVIWSFLSRLEASHNRVLKTPQVAFRSSASAGV